MTYNETIEYLYNRLPVFHRIGPKALKPGLDNTLRLCEALGNPQTQFQSIHVAGTNGKGSTSHMLASIYQEAGYKVGLYTSPHLKSFTERIRINGQPIPETEVVQFVEQTRSLLDAIEPSFFELTVAMAFAYFARERVDLAIIEVGLGGRLDSTNVITPLVSVITNIGYDHMDVLGDTLPQIAREKAGIIKPGIPAVVGEYLPETRPVFEAVATQHGAPIYFASDRFEVLDEGILDERRQVEVIRYSLHSGSSGRTNFYQLDLIGTYQLKNLATVLQTVELAQNSFAVGQESLENGLKKTVENTGILGRFQTLQHHPRVVADTAHNVPGIIALLEMIATIPHTQLRIVIGCAADKNPEKILAELPRQALFYLCKADSPRSMPVEELAKQFKRNSLIYREFNNVNNAIQQAICDSVGDELIVVTGSNYIVAELNYLTL